jgi:putative oxidoreductase
MSQSPEGMSSQDVWSRAWGVAVARVVLGILFGMRGWDKVFNMTPAVHATKFFTGPYADSWIPQWLLWVTGVTIPFIELISGWLLVFGLFTRSALVGAGLVLMTVTYGHMLANPLFNDVFIFTRTAMLVVVAMVPRSFDRLSIDYWLSRRKVAGTRDVRQTAA